jgi:uncharacterized repeat protein (TIGR03803 family)
VRTTSHSLLLPFLALSKTMRFLVVFCMAMAIVSPAQTFTTLASFNLTNGADPVSSVIQGTDGNFYGTALAGGNSDPNCNASFLGGCGTVFKVTSQGQLTALYSFCPQSPCPDGSAPGAALVQGNDGNFYGTTRGGGVTNPPCYSNGCGTVFKVTPTGTLTTLYKFCSQANCTDGSAPYGGLVQGTDGNFYGTTYGGGTSGFSSGTVFKITPTGTLTTLYSFCSQHDCPDGAHPYAGLVQATDGNFYGTTSMGGNSSNNGTFFRITPSGTLTTLHSFCSQYPCPDGGVPWAALTQATDGNLYGTTFGGAGYNNGTVFKTTLEGALTTLHKFCSQPNCADGAWPYGGVVQATDGNFYGTTYTGGANTQGVVFEITPAGALTVLHSFNGAYPQAGVVQATDGNLYGTTSDGGSNCPPFGCGAVYTLNVGLAPFVETQPSSGPVGAPVTILGTHLAGSTSVTFNGTPATFTVVSDSQITTNVPAGATTGTVQVMTPGGALTSNADFQVTGPLQLIPVSPCRLVDTRQTGGPIQGGTSRNFIVPELGGCGIPASAAAYSLNVTVVPHGSLRYLTIWPDGEVQPFVSTMNSPDGRVKANAAIVPAGNNAVSVFVSNTTDVVLDVNGYFAPPSSGTYQFYPLTPCRLVDTRNGQDQGTLQAGVERDYLIAGTCGVPADAMAYSFNVTVLPTEGSLDYLTVWPQGESMPVVSTLNDNTGTVVANAAIVAAGNNTIAFYAHNHNTNLLLDINGYFAAPAQNGLSMYPTVPCRVLDTRQNNGQPFRGELTVNVVGSVCAPPSNAQAYIFNATVVPGVGGLGYLTLWPDGSSQPGVSTLNAPDGAVTSNMAIVPNINGSTDAFASALTQLILDISGYFAS